MTQNGRTSPGRLTHSGLRLRAAAPVLDVERLSEELRITTKRVSRARRPLILLPDYAVQLGELREERNRLAQV